MSNNPDSLLPRVIDEARRLKIPVSRCIDPHVRINSRAVGRFGLCTKKDGHFTIEISERMLTAPEKSCLQTLAHEVLHTCPDCTNHQSRWKCYAAAMNAAYGYDIKRTGDCAALGVAETRVARYTVKCEKCGALISRQRRSAVITHPERYRCKCGGRLLPEKG